MRRALIPLLVLAAGCVGVQRHHRSSALEYLYPQGAAAAPALDVRIQLPVRVGLAFAPSAPAPGALDPFTEDQKQKLLARVADQFRGRPEIGSIDIIPTSHLTPEGGFEELGRIQQAYGLDLVALLSYDQFQFSESAKSSWTYWTIVGAYVVEGEKNETRTVLDAVVYDIPSRAMLFHASGQSSVAGRSTPVEMERELREASAQGFERATDDLVAQLDRALTSFQEQASTGTVHGAGTPAVAILDEAGRPAQGSSGAGAAGLVELAVALSCACLALAARRSG